MPTYIYETIPQNDEPVEHYEIEQSIKDPTLTKHPDTGAPIRRVILGGSVMIKRESSNDCCGGSGCC